MTNVDEIRTRAEQGDEAAQFNLGICFLTGEGVPRNPNRAAPLFRQAAERGHARAQQNLGSLLTSGWEGANPDPVEGHRWILAAAEQGDPNSQYDAAQGFRLGRGCNADPALALSFYRAAADQGHTGAMFSLGLMLADGMGVDSPRPDLAEQWYQRAAMAGHGGAAHNLGILFARGNGVAQDLDLAVELCEFAVSLGEDSAMFSAGLAEVQKPEPDWVRAATWARVSIRHEPNGSGAKLLQHVAQRMSPEQMAESEARAACWTREPKTMAWLSYRVP